MLINPIEIRIPSREEVSRPIESTPFARFRTRIHSARATADTATDLDGEDIAEGG